MGAELTLCPLPTGHLVKLVSTVGGSRQREKREAMPYPRSGLPLASRMILENLRKVAQESGGEGYPFDYSMADCAEELSISQRTVSRSLRQLQDAALIDFEPGRGQRPTRVRLLLAPDPDSDIGQGVNPDD